MSEGDTVLVLIDLSCGKQRLGGSVLAQCFGQFGGPAADLDSPKLLAGFFQAQRVLREKHLLLAYHDRSDGGLFATLVEMAFASRTGLEIQIRADVFDVLRYLFNEEPGAVVQVRVGDLQSVQAFLPSTGWRSVMLSHVLHPIQIS